MGYCFLPKLSGEPLLHRVCQRSSSGGSQQRQAVEQEQRGGAPLRRWFGFYLCVWGILFFFFCFTKCILHQTHLALKLNPCSWHVWTSWEAEGREKNQESTVVKTPQVCKSLLVLISRLQFTKIVQDTLKNVCSVCASEFPESQKKRQPGGSQGEPPQNQQPQLYSTSTAQFPPF